MIKRLTVLFQGHSAPVFEIGVGDVRKCNEVSDEPNA